MNDKTNPDAGVPVAVPRAGADEAVWREDGGITLEDVDLVIQELIARGHVVLEPEQLPAPPSVPAAGDFRAEVERLINRLSLEGGSDTPDFILAQYLADCLAAYDRAVCRREAWYGRRPGP